MGDLGECQPLPQGAEWALWISTFKYHSTTITCDIFLAGMQAFLTEENNEHGCQFLGTKAGRLMGFKMFLGAVLIMISLESRQWTWVRRRKDSRQWLLNNC